ncbi:ABC transporter ATP-binding protein [Roseivirga echinicomitans]|uniref:ABC transporter ATP-binding protein n=1 Tax=Roseivirga echinicomitans TaxID=296218 RepID=A0A150XCZ9_9BACT|nr:ATP-binding cassette domain-containing protein [Roseivirga echinicomitans]KYG76607.1 ABC transporter ATP-binding protein [Roseivirga echinicomitans]
MRVEVENLGKKYAKEWVFRELNMEFNSQFSYAITGPNGSGKSTLLQMLTGVFLPTEGTVSYFQGDKTILEENFYKHLDIVTPYLELIEEFTLDEFLKFHFKFKQLSEGVSIDDFIQHVYLEKDRDKQLQNFSSGMKQRLKLGLSFYSQSPICFLDEPTSNLDEQGTAWYLTHVKKALDKKLVIISSNQKHEYDFCDKIVSIPDFK